MADFSRSLDLSGASNFRDLGGYASQDGRLVRWRRIFRSDHLASLTPQDRQLLAGLGVARAVDFRGQAESAALSYELPHVRYQALPIEPIVVQRAKEMALAGQPMTAPTAVRLMQDTYRAFVSDNTSQFASLFEQLLLEDTPLVFHCTAGKDRTGFAAALLLRLLGVPHEVVLQDYLLTNERLQHRVPGSALPAPIVHVLHRVQTEFLGAAFDALEQDHGSLDAYVRDGLMLGPAELAQLRAKMLE